MLQRLEAVLAEVDRPSGSARRGPPGLDGWEMVAALAAALVCLIYVFWKVAGCLYAANIENLLMAGKHISVTHVAGSSVKLMGNGAQHGVATAAAAFLCNEQDTTPRGLLEDHLDKLRNLVDALTGHDHDMTSHPPARKFVAVPG